MPAILVALALTGLAVVQIVMLRKTIAAEEDAFQRNAVVALSRAADALTAGEILRVIVSSATDSIASDPLTQVQVDSIVAQMKARHRDVAEYYQWTTTDSLRFHESIDTTFDSSSGRRLMQIEIEATSDDSGSYVSDSSVRRFPVHHQAPFWEQSERRGIVCPGSDSLLVQSRQFSMYDIVTFTGPDSVRAILVAATLDQLAEQEMVPIIERLDTLEIDSVIGESLAAEGIDLDFTFGILDGLNGRLEYLQAPADSAAIATSSISTRLFPHDVLSRPRELVVHFPAKNAYLLRQLVPVAVPAGLFLLVIAAAFGYTVRVAINQRRFSKRLSDFINNMTHEFKTPISTIQLASEALSRDDVARDPSRIGEFNRMIRDENRRMKMQVDKILQMAVLEDGAEEIRREPVDLHAIISSATETVRMMIGSREGQLDTRLDAARSVVGGDPVHLYNVVANLLDNACKYSPGAPQLRVSTELRGEHVVLRVADRGIGIDESDRKRVFERYYRVATGDRHDVKGFGLGLAYVKLVVEALGGEVRINSQLGTGTEVLVELPLISGEA